MGCRGEEVPQAVSKARYHMKARQEAAEDKCRPECTLARCLCRLDGPQEPKGGYHGIRVRQARQQGPMWLQMAEDEGAPLVYFHQVKQVWVGYADSRRGTAVEGVEADERQANPHGFHSPAYVSILYRVGDLLVRSSCGPRLRGHHLYSVSLGPPHRPVVVHHGINYPDPVHFCVRVPLSGHSSALAHCLPNIQRHRQDLPYGVPQPHRSACAVHTQRDLRISLHLHRQHRLLRLHFPCRKHLRLALKRVEQPLMRLVGEAEEVRVERAEEIQERAIPRASESQMGRCAEAEEAGDIKEKIRLALE